MSFTNINELSLLLKDGFFYSITNIMQFKISVPKGLNTVFANGFQKKIYIYIIQLFKCIDDIVLRLFYKYIFNMNKIQKWDCNKHAFLLCGVMFITPNMLLVWHIRVDFCCCFVFFFFTINLRFIYNKNIYYNKA